MNYSAKLTSGALQLSVFIAVIIALLLSGIMLYLQTYTFSRSQSEAAIRNIQLADRGIFYSLVKKDNSGDTITIPYTGSTVKSISNQWGIFKKVYSESRFRKSGFSKVAFAATRLNNSNSPVLYLQDNNIPLALVGNTTITGLAYIPKSGVKAGYISGNSFYNPQLIDGVIRTSEASLPAINKNIISGLKSYCGRNPDHLPRFDGGDYIRSFKDGEELALAGTNFTINSKLTGNLIIYATNKITVESTSELNDVILIAPHIEIESGTKGRFQAIASKKIYVGQNSLLSYPSALVLVTNEDENTQHASKLNGSNIEIANGSEIYGVVCYLAAAKENNYSSNIFLAKASKVFGQVYCEGNTEVYGEIVGNVFTHYFVTSSAGTIYLNHLFNSTITYDKRVGSTSGLLFSDGDDIVIKWLP